jgi:ABC-2 type transport system permease protein
MIFSGRRLIADVKYGLIQFLRDRRSMVFSFVMPILFLVLGWFLFGVPAGISYLGYLMPGILGIAVMGSTIDLTVGVIAGYRAAGLLKKIATTPVSGVEWNLSRAITGLAVALLSVTASLLAAWLMFGYVPALNAIVIAMFVAGSIMSTGIGMLIVYLVRDREAANMASFTLTFPMILISGSIFPTEQLPDLLKVLVALSPLTYLNSGLRNAMMASGSPHDAMVSLAIVSVLGVAFFAVGLIILKWRDS